MGRSRFHSAKVRALRRTVTLCGMERLEPRCVLSADVFSTTKPAAAQQLSTPVDEHEVGSIPIAAQVGTINASANAVGEVATNRLNTVMVQPAQPKGSEFIQIPAYELVGTNGYLVAQPVQLVVMSIPVWSHRGFDGGFFGWQTEVIGYFDRGDQSAALGVGGNTSRNDLAISAAPHLEYSLGDTSKVVPESRDDEAPHAALHSSANPGGIPNVGQTVAAESSNAAVPNPTYFPGAHASVVATQRPNVQLNPSLDRSAGLLPGGSSTQPIDNLSGDEALRIKADPNLPTMGLGSIAADALVQVDQTPVPAVPTSEDLAQATTMSNVPFEAESLAGIPLNLKHVEQSLHAVMSRIALLGGEIHEWLDDAHLTPMVAAIAGAAAGAAAGYYLRRRGKAGDEQGDEESSSWLFARLQPFPGDG